VFVDEAHAERVTCHPIHFVVRPGHESIQRHREVPLAALYLVKFAGAPAGQPIDAYRAAILDYNHDPAYVDRVLADAHDYQGAGTAQFGPSCSAALGTPLVPGTKARILPSGDAPAPANAPPVVQEMI